jgi:hypothetical protein
MLSPCCLCVCLCLYFSLYIPPGFCYDAYGSTLLCIFAHILSVFYAVRVVSKEIILLVIVICIY